MGAGRVAPAAVVVGESVVGGAEVGRGDEDGGVTRVAPLRRVSAFDLKTRPTAVSLVEKGRAQCCRVDAVTLAVQVAVSTSTPCIRIPIRSKSINIGGDHWRMLLYKIKLCCFFC